MFDAGGCRCGSNSYRLTGSAPVHVYVCHCLNCQTRSGSAFAQHAMVPNSAIVFDGPTVVYASSDNGIEFEDVFCAVCYTRLYNRNSALPEMIFLRAGTLADSGQIAPIAHIWTKRRQSWVEIPEGIPLFAESPTPEEFGQAVSLAELRRR